MTETVNETKARKRIRLPGRHYRLGHAFFVTVRAHGKRPWFGSYLELADACVQILRDVGSQRLATLFAWCVMPDHCHLLAADKDMVEYVRLFKGRMVPEARRCGIAARLWKRSFFDRGVRGDESLPDIARYIWENPVRAGIVETPDRYMWSGSEAWPQWREWYQR